MRMDPDDIERRDFPPTQPGHDPEAVHVHLRRVADELDERPTAAIDRGMALEGAARADTARFLAEHYVVADLETLLDGVHASAGQ